MRRNAIIHLVAMSAEQPPEQYYNTAIGILVEYVKSNIDARRGPFDQVEVDDREPETYRPADIIDALEALRTIRRAGGNRHRVELRGIDFHRIILSKLDLEGFYFGHADFTDASLSDCLCRGADFRHAKFLNTAVWGTRELLPADLARSKWANVDFDGSNIGKATGQDKVAFFRHISGLTEEQRALFPGEGR